MKANQNHPEKTKRLRLKEDDYQQEFLGLKLWVERISADAIYALNFVGK